ncbi:hypothetical protein B0H17DRAFT_1212389 [Mycena rosella]|uniref:Uncharacterized protein n=1 Tax=Mycena rosella TaxID=1033263 RepID=A0AAD7CS95_MYCRO|nr:hypothetical protein B0H17DRAFT_1212389 [Mycena rosella]
MSTARLSRSRESPITPFPFTIPGAPVSRSREGPVPLSFWHPGTYASHTSGITGLLPPTAQCASSTAPLSIHKKTAACAAGPSPTPTASTGFRFSKVFRRTQSVYLGTSCTVVIPTTRAPLVALRAVREDATWDKTEPERLTSVAPPPPPQQQHQPTGSWVQKVIRRTQSTPCFSTPPGALRGTDGGTETLPLLLQPIQRTTPPEFGTMRVKHGGNVSNGKTSGIGNRPPGVSTFFYCAEPSIEEDLDESMPEVCEALQVNARICAMGYRYQRVEV